MPFQIAIAGYRHYHIQDIIDLARSRNDIQVVGLCEDHEATRTHLQDLQLEFPLFKTPQEMLDRITCDAVAIGDYYQRRGSIAKFALSSGKHVLSDKPLCTSLLELEEIKRLAKARGVAVSCQLDMRGHGSFRRLKRSIEEGDVGEIHAISFNGQHPLNFGTRPEWYFEEGKHGGTINDIAIHALDAIPWLTGMEFQTINAARNWSTRPHSRGEGEPPATFRDAAQVMLTLSNGGGVLGDVSYLSPDNFGFGLPYYWQTVCWGSVGVAETGVAREDVIVRSKAQHTPSLLAADPHLKGFYLDSMLREIDGKSAVGDITTEGVLQSTRIALLAQEAADQNLSHVVLR